MYYVGYEGCNCSNDTYFQNRNGVIYLASSTIEGPEGVTGPYKDIEIIMRPDNTSEPWEGLQGVASFSNPWQVKNDTFYAFYASQNTQLQPNETQYSTNHIKTHFTRTVRCKNTRN